MLVILLWLHPIPTADIRVLHASTHLHIDALDDAGIGLAWWRIF